VERIFRESLAGNGLKEIAVGLNRDGLTTATGKRWGTTSVHNVLHNEAYAGTLVWDRRRKRRPFGRDGASVVRSEDAWTGIVDQQTFEEVQKKLASRAPKKAHPRVVHSHYLLSGMIHCKSCGASMIGLVAKSGQFFYYVCSSARRKGREVCDTPLLPKEKVEAFVIDRIKQNILTNENMEELIRLTNEELAASCSDDEERLQVLRMQLNDVESRLGKLYDALETGKFGPEQLAPRINALCQRKEELDKAKTEIEGELHQQRLELADPVVIAAYVQDLKKLLSESSIMEQKAFLKSFIKSVEVDGTHLAINYTIPLVAGPCEGELTEEAMVLPIIQNGSPFGIKSRTRTVSRVVLSGGKGTV